MKRRNPRRTRWIVLAVTGLLVLALTSMGATARADAAGSGESDTLCRKVEDPTGTITIDQDGLVMTVTVGTYPDVEQPNANNAITSVQIDPASVVKTGVITVKGGPSSVRYSFGVTPPMHAPVLDNGKWPTISYIEVCWQKLGRAEVTKAVVGTGVSAGQEFSVALTPVAGGGEITKTVTAGQTVAFEGLDPGVYTLSELDPGVGWTVAYSSTSITVVAGQTASATVTNTYSPRAPETGRVEVTKVVAGEGAPIDQVFMISLTPDAGSAISKTVTGAGTVAFEELTPGVYTLSETDPGRDWTVAYSSSTVVVVAGQTSSASVTNTYAAAPLPGRVEVTKVVAGEGALADQMFEITLTPAGGSAIAKTITGPGVIPFENLTPGVYTVSESYPGSGWTVAYSATTLTVLAGQTSTATVTNTYVQQLAPSGLGSVIVNKIVSGDPPPTTYYVGLVGPAPATTERWLTVTGAGEVTFPAMPVGTYTVVERDPGTHYTVTISPATVAVTTDGVARATVTNAFSEVAPSVGTLPRSGAGATPLIATLAATLLIGGTALTAVGHRRRVS